MRAAAIFGLGSSSKNLKHFQGEDIDWRIGAPATADQADVILVFGGDGTIHRHLGQLVKLGLPVLIVPTGSGNDFARALRFRHVRDSREAWRRFCNGQENVRTIDLGRITQLENAGEGARATLERYFCCVAGVGLDGEVARSANKVPRWIRGHGGYILSLVPSIFRFAPLRMKILTPQIGTGGEPPGEASPGWQVRSNQPTILAALANTPTYGGGMKIAPHALMDDGLLDVCIVGSVDPFKLFCLFPTVYAGRHLDIREVDYFSADRARVETEHPLDVYADGEFVCRTPVEISVARATLRVLIP